MNSLMAKEWPHFIARLPLGTIGYAVGRSEP
jgi:hypothetical protein